MPATYRSNISWRSKEEHDAAKRYCEERGEALSEHIQDHFRLALKRAKKA